MQITQSESMKPSVGWVGLIVVIVQLCIMTTVLYSLLGSMFVGSNGAIAATSVISACWLTASGYYLARRYDRRMVALSTVAAVTPFAMFAMFLLAAPHDSKGTAPLIGWVVITFVAGFLSFVGAYLARYQRQ